MLIIEIFIQCNGVGCDANFGVDTRQLSGRQQRDRAKENGWVFSGGKDFCPDCRPRKADGTVHKCGADRKQKRKNNERNN